MHVSYNLDKNVQNYKVSQQNSEPKNLQQHASVLHTAFRNHIYVTLKTLLNSDVKRRELINFTNFPLETHIYIYIYIYIYTCSLLLFSIIRNKRNY